jgi:hypothetical protein
MSIHTEISNKLYEYCVGELDSSDRAGVETHLSACDRCSHELEEIKASIQLIGKPAELPSAARSGEYWQRFSFTVEDKIRRMSDSKKISVGSLWDRMQSYFIVNRGPVIAAGTASVVIVCAAVLWKVITPAPEQEEFARLTNEEKPAIEQVTPAVNTNERLGNYIKKSKILLVGLSNMKTESGHPIDLSFERQTSRSLIKEARFLQTQNIDRRSARLIDDLNKILVELANLEEEHDVPDVEIIRGGIHQENLLFKIRMAEARYDSSSLIEKNTL